MFCKLIYVQCIANIKMCWLNIHSLPDQIEQSKSFTTQIFINNSSTFRRFYCVFILLDSTPLFILRLHKRFTIFRIYRIWDTLENNRGIFTDSETHPEFTDFETLPILRLHRFFELKTVISMQVRWLGLG